MRLPPFKQTQFESFPKTIQLSLIVHCIVPIATTSIHSLKIWGISPKYFYSRVLEYWYSKDMLQKRERYNYKYSKPKQQEVYAISYLHTQSYYNKTLGLWNHLYVIKRFLKPGRKTSTLSKISTITVFFPKLSCNAVCLTAH